MASNYTVSCYRVICFSDFTSFQAVLLNLGDKNYVEKCVQQIYMFENLKKIILENDAERFIETMIIMKHCIGVRISQKHFYECILPLNRFV